MGKGGCSNKKDTQVAQNETIDGTRNPSYTTPEKLHRSHRESTVEQNPNEEYDPLIATNFDETTTNAEELPISSENPHDAKLIEYMEALQADLNNHSMTKKLLTRDLAVDQANVRTATNEGLGQCVYVNVNNPQVLMPYATSPDCYNTFADFFGEIIERIHGAPQKYIMLTPQFGSSTDTLGVDLNSFDRRRERVLYTEICVRRNIQGTAFTPQLSKNGRMTIISKVEPKLREAWSELEEVAWIPAEWERHLDASKNELDDVGSMLEYPDDRLSLAFVTEKGLCIGAVLNFDDHLQLIASSQDGRLGDLVTEMAALLEDDRLPLDYWAHPVYGHLTLNPAHIGTGLSVRIVAKLPFVSRLADADVLVADYGISACRETELRQTGLIVLSNRVSLNKTEADIVRNLVRAFNKLSALEDELEITTPMSVQEDNMGVENAYRVRDTIAESRAVSYTNKYLTENVLIQLARVESNFGAHLTHCVRHNAHHPQSLFPRACDADCYVKFQSFFDPIILETNGAGSFSHARLPVYGSTVADKRYLLSHPAIYSYRVRFTRNLTRFPFPNMMSGKDRRMLERFLLAVLAEIPVELEGEYCPLRDLGKSVYLEDMIENRLVTSPSKVDISAGFCREWPDNRGVYMCKKNIDYPSIFLLLILNVKDHIKVVGFDPTGKALHICYERAVNMMRFLDLRLESLYASRAGYGFLTSAPNSVGTAMRVSALVRLRNLGERREELETLCRSNQFVYRGSNGAGSPAVNNVFDLSYKHSLNVTEKYVLLIFVQRLKEIILAERKFDPRIPRPSNEDKEENSDSVDYTGRDISGGSSRSDRSLHSNIDQVSQDAAPVIQSQEAPGKTDGEVPDSVEKMNGATDASRTDSAAGHLPDDDKDDDKDKDEDEEVKIVKNEKGGCCGGSKKSTKQ